MLNIRTSTARVLLCLLLPGVAGAASAQDEADYVSDDAGRTTGAVWTEVGATKLLPYNLTVGLDAGFRTDDWFNEASRFDVSLSLGWKPNKHWKFGVGYTFLIKHYNTETERKTEQELEYKYRAAGASESTDFPAYMGAPIYTDDGGTKYTYKGYNDATKNFTRVTDAYWRPRHRISIDAAYTNKFWSTLRVTLRERYQLSFVPSKEVNRVKDRVKTVTRYRDYDSDTDTYEEIFYYYQDDATIYRLDKTDADATPTDYTAAYLADHDGEYLNTTETSVKEKSSKTLHVLRSRLTFEMDKKGWQWTPYIYIESFNNLGERFHLDKLRASAGVEYAVTKQHKLSLGYIFNHENDDDGDENIHAISIGYKFKF